MKSKRKDGRGHWPRGKRRSLLSPAKTEIVKRRLRRAVEKASIRSVARAIGISDRSIRRIFDGEDEPTERMYNLTREL